MLLKLRAGKQMLLSSCLNTTVSLPESKVSCGRSGLWSFVYVDRKEALFIPGIAMAVDARIIIVVLLLLVTDPVAPLASANRSSSSSPPPVPSLSVPNAGAGSVYLTQEMQEQRRSELGVTISGEEEQYHKKKHHCKKRRPCKCKRKEEGGSSSCPYYGYYYACHCHHHYYSKADLRAQCSFGLTIAALILHKFVWSWILTPVTSFRS